MSTVSGRLGAWLHRGLDRVDVLAAMRATRRECSFEGDASPTPGCHDLGRDRRRRGDEPLSDVRCNKLASRARSKPSRW
jgi:hypothetical protein